MPIVTTTPRLQADLTHLARGRAIVIDYFASARCGVVVGDITANFDASPPSETHVRLPNVEGVPVFAEPRLIRLLEESMATIDRPLLPMGDGLALMLGRPEKWLEFLDRPGISRPWWHRRQDGVRPDRRR
jgi:hypothetical protein